MCKLTWDYWHSNLLSAHKGLADLYSSVSESSSSEYWVSPLPPARSPRATRSPAAFPYPVYFNRLSTKRWHHRYKRFLHVLGSPVLIFSHLMCHTPCSSPDQTTARPLLPLSLQRTKRNSAAVCFTPMSTCVIRRTSLFLMAVPISGLIFTSFSGGRTWGCTDYE